MSQSEESRSDRSYSISKKENKVRLSKIFDFSSKKDNQSDLHKAKISFNSPLLAKIKVKQSKRVLENRPRFGSSTCRFADNLS